MVRVPCLKGGTLPVTGVTIEAVVRVPCLKGGTLPVTGVTGPAGVGGSLDMELLW